MDTTDWPDGWREIRLAAIVTTPDDKRFFNSSGIPIFVNNGNPRDDYERYCDNRSLIGRGWYEGFGYTNAIIECVPLEPVSGVHTFRVRSQKDSGHLEVALDKTHHIPPAGSWVEQHDYPGELLFDADGEFDSFFPIEVDTTQLTNGWHSLAVRSQGPDGDVSECAGCSGEVSFPSGTAKVWFYVQNPAGGE